MRLLTNNPAKRVGLDGYGLHIIERCAAGGVANAENIRYLMTKRDRMGHDLVGLEDYDEAVPGEFGGIHGPRRSWATSFWFDVIDGCPQVQGRSICAGRSIHRYDSTLVGSNGYDETAIPTSSSSPRGSPASRGMNPRQICLHFQECRDSLGGGRREDRRPLAQCDPDPRHESARRDGAARVEEVGLSEQARGRHGGHPRLGAIPPVHRPELHVSVGERHRVRAGRHGDTMVPLPRTRTWRAFRSPSSLSKEKIEALVQRTGHRRRRGDRRAG